MARTPSMFAQSSPRRFPRGCVRLIIIVSLSWLYVDARSARRIETGRPASGGRKPHRADSGEFWLCSLALADKRYAPAMDLNLLRAELARTPSVAPAGRVRAVTGLAVRATLPGARIGEVVRIRRRGEPLDAEIV